MSWSINGIKLACRVSAMTINTLLPYAVWQEQGDKPELLDTFLCAAKASKWVKFTWNRTRELASTLLSEASPQAIILASPYIPPHIDRGDLLPLWAVAASAVSYTEEVAQSVVDTLLQIASNDKLLPHITADMWSWLEAQPSLPPTCQGRHLGTYLGVIKAVQGLKDVEVLKSYLHIIWSEWIFFQGDRFDEVCTLICEDFSGIKMSYH